jgi:NAD(P)-dependent dehydrogenase (short-subunit alcohol dehydrogenase family)
MLKAALERFSQGIAMDLQADGIAVNVLSPQGFIRTPGGIFGQNDREHPNLDFEPAHAMGKAAAWLCQQPATYTGHILYDEEVCKAQGV